MRLLWSKHGLQFLLLLHLLELGHLDEDLVDLLVREALEDVGPLRLVELLLGDALFLQILEVPDSVGPVAHVSLQSICHALSALSLGVSEESFGPIHGQSLPRSILEALTQLVVLAHISYVLLRLGMAVP